MIRRPFFALPASFALALLVGCGPSGTTAGAERGKGEDGKAGAETGGDEASEETAGDGPFENPGGMWMPGQMTDHADTLAKLGVEFPPADLTDPTSFPLGAVVSLGGCSASFVSPKGLIITNHHCVTGALQYNSTPDSNLMKDGFLAKDLSEERSAGPTARVYVTLGFENVSDKVFEGTDGLDDQARHDKIESNRKALTSECEKDRPEMRCRVASYFEGAEFYRIEQLQIRDVRLVHAPHAGVGVYGGEIDNWRWPRHTGDYSFLRAYVGPDGKPADYDAKNNVPYEPPHHLKLASSPLRKGEFAMVAGYPGRTSRLKTADEVDSATNWSYPRRVARYEQYIALLEQVTEGNDELKIKAASTLRGLNNGLTNNKGMLDGLAKGGLAKRRAEDEAKLQAWIDEDPGRKEKWGSVLEEIAKLNAEERKTRERDAAFAELMRASSLLGRARMLVKMAENRDKPDAERDSGYQERDWPRTKQGINASGRRYAREIDRAVFKMHIERAQALGGDDRPAAVDTIVGEAGDVDAALDALYAKTKLEDEKAVLKLYETASTDKLKGLGDPFIDLAMELGPTMDEMEERGEKWSGAMARLRPAYIAALREHAGKPIAPDANSTLRITYGTVRGYAPSPDKPVYEPFTVVSEMVAKHTGEEPFDAPENVRKAIEAKRFGPYVDEVLGEVPIDFLADLDITGGNSGSATLNGKGELIGLAFDGNYEAMASDWIFMPEITRSIHVDIRYVLWVMDAVDGADHLIEEMGGTPAIEPAADEGAD